MKLDGTIPDAGTMWLREVVIKGLVWNSFSGLSLIAYIWPFFDCDRQALHDKMLTTFVIHYPGSPEQMTPVPVTPEEQFGPQVVTAPAQSVENVEEALRSLVRMRDDGLITNEEYEAKRAALVEKL